MAIVWFTLFNIVSAVQTAGITAAHAVGSDTGNFTLINTFVTNVMTWFLTIALLGLSYWVYIYSQRKAEAP